MRKIVLILIATSLLISCDRLKEGTVVQKKIDPERYYIMTVPHVVSTGKTTMIWYSYIPMYDDQDYLIEIEGYTEKHKLKDRWVDIPKEMYDTIKIKDWYCIDNMCHVSDEDAEDERTIN